MDYDGGHRSTGRGQDAWLSHCPSPVGLSNVCNFCTLFEETAISTAAISAHRITGQEVGLIGKK
jgi:hypothetical protein